MGWAGPRRTPWPLLYLLNIRCARIPILLSTPETVANWLFAHPRRRIKIKLCMVGGLRCVVIHVKCDPNRLRGYGAVGVENGRFLLRWPVAYTTACTTVQVVINSLIFAVIEHWLIQM